MAILRFPISLSEPCIFDKKLYNSKTNNLNNSFFGQMKCQNAYNKFRMGLYVEFGWKMAVWEPKEKKI
jgi:hypothetical protein